MEHIENPPILYVAKDTVMQQRTIGSFKYLSNGDCLSDFSNHIVDTYAITEIVPENHIALPNYSTGRFEDELGFGIGFTMEVTKNKYQTPFKLSK